MSDEQQKQDASPKTAMPSNSTIVGGIGGAGVGTVLVWVCRAFFKVEMPPDVAVIVGSLIGNAVGYFFEGGRKA